MNDDDRTLAGAGSVQSAIAAYLGTVAGWRRRKADEYDRDQRNLRSAAAIDELAAYVRSLPDDDPRIDRLRALAMEGEQFVPGQQTSYEIGRFRFFSDVGEPDPFLTALVDLAERDAGERGHFGGQLPEGDDPWE